MVSGRRQDISVVYCPLSFAQANWISGSIRAVLQDAMIVCPSAHGALEPIHWFRDRRAEREWSQER